MVRWGLAALALMAGVAAAAPSPSTAQLDHIVDTTAARYHLAGVAVGVIDHGEVIYTRTLGERVAGSGEPITPDTLFKIASHSKAMTATLLARLVEQGRLRWDTPVRSILADFRMADPWVTEHMQVGDLLTHRSGLREGAGDLMLWPEPNAFTRKDILHALAYLKPAYSFRAGYAYDNLLYVVAGDVAAAAGHDSYDALLRREVFDPLGLTRCQIGTWQRDRVGNVAQPHAWKDGRNVVIRADEATIPDITSAAAGGVRCSLTDMLTWARNWLAPTPEQLRWLSPDQRQILWTPYTPMPISARRRAWDGTRLYAYGYGWRIADVDGQLTVSHTGTLSGMYSAMTLLPDRKAGFVVLINSEAEDARTVLVEALTKQFTSPDDPRDVDGYADELAHATKGSHEATITPSSQAATADELRKHLGRWRDPWFGAITVCPQGGTVRFAAAKSPRLTGTVMRAGQRYLVHWDHDDADAWLAFPQSADGILHMNKVDPAADFSYDFEDLAFQREHACD
ncbi:serine hydrolase [Dyella japonica]|uniref:Penicillin-binding protein n=1 Tax=Dyella japonica A8 TaxID=1217721 RepID=A0A075K3L5_9GAMM|nr:serine hydrolase [Dyella japonica]AIF46778.1 penicillin-binding protein [Dyella japonica A8]